MNQNCMNGTSIIAMSNDTPRMMVTAQGKLVRKSRIMPVVVNKNGKNVMLMASVAEKIERRKWSVLSIDACQRETPSPIFSR